MAAGGPTAPSATGAELAVRALARRSLHPMPEPADIPISDETAVIGDGRWRMWAVRDSADTFSYPGHRRYAAAHATQGEPVVAVIVSEDPDGPYWGWIHTDGDEPQMIYRHGVAFRMCFPYGPQAEQDAGRGRIVHLTVTAMEDDA